MECRFSAVHGQLRVPPSKSYTQRALVAAMLHTGTTDILFAGNSEDERAVLEIVKQQSRTEPIPEGWRVTSTGGHLFNGTFNCGESGLAARLLGPVAALSKQKVTIAGKGSLLNRSMDFMGLVLSELGVQVHYEHLEHILPLSVQGPLIPADIRVNGGMSSQFISGLLFAFAFRVEKKTSIEVHNAVSIPYLDMSCAMLESFGKKIIRPRANLFEINPNYFTHRDRVEIRVESDWSSAAFWICAAALNGTICLEGLHEKSLQADRHILDVLAQTGTKYSFSSEVLKVTTGDLRPFETDLTHCPDLFPVLSVLAAACPGVSRLSGIHRLHQKESDRAAAICSLLSQLSVPFQIDGDSLIIKGGHPNTPDHIEVPSDHRMVMAAALASNFSRDSVTISNANSIAKSYPDFFQHLAQLGQ